MMCSIGRGAIMADKKIKWTAQQAEAIKHRKRDVLVTASAGTGKTAVLSGRAVDIVAEERICPDIWSMLVLTFTDAAAEQMRQRIGKQLRDVYRQSKDARLRKQLILLQGADISTIHSFCKRLITEYFYELDLDPAFGIIDSDEQKLLKAEVMEQTIEWAWAQSDLAPALEEMLAGRDVRPSEGFLKCIMEISEFLNGVVSPGDWLNRVAKLSSDSNPGDIQRKIIRDLLSESLEQLQHAEHIYASRSDDIKWPEKLRKTHIEPIEKLYSQADSQNWDELIDTINELKLRAPALKDIDENIKNVLKDLLNGVRDNIKSIQSLAVINPDYLDRIESAAGRQSLVLIELVKKFESLYSQVKRSINRLDFADLERYALKLLARADSLCGKPEPSDTAVVLQERYKHIFVDEYQDINPVQKAIIDLVGSGDNVFVVGDVKQSIYAFRGAEPAIFIEGLKSSSSQPDETQQSKRVDLNRNFRSAKGILDFVNSVFTRIMSESFCGIDYNEAAALVPAFEDDAKQQVAPASTPRIELHLMDAKIEEPSSSQDDSDSIAEQAEQVSARQRQAVLIAKRIRQMTGADSGQAEFEIFDKESGTTRPVEYRDIVVLMRSLSGRADDYVEVFQLAGVPVSCRDAAGYFEATEVRDMLSLLKVLDNPQRDIELAAVFRGPFFRINDTELAKVRLHDASKEKSFYDCVSAYLESGEDEKLTEKLQSCLADIEKWRSIGRSGSIADLIWQVYRETNLPAFVSALPNGRGRKANLLKLHERAIQFEGFAGSGGTASLGRFVRFIEKLHQSGAKWAGAEPPESSANAVRIMSVHKSKGLEFPVVILAELSGQFNLKDAQSDILLGTDVPIGLTVVDRAAKAKLAGTAHQVLAHQKRLTNLAEEMRIMYVAMTRAKERLLLTGCGKRSAVERILTKGYHFGGVIPDWQLRRCGNSLDWILYSLADQKALQDALGTGCDVPESTGLFDVNYYEANRLGELSQYLLDAKTASRQQATADNSSKDTDGLFEKVKERLSWRYDYAEATQLPAKQSVTQLTHHSDEFVKIDYSRSLERLPKVVDLENAKKQVVDGRMIGSAVHAVIKDIDLNENIDSSAVRSVIDDLIGRGCINAETAGSIDIDSIVKFFDSDLGQTALRKDNKIMREWPFTFSLPADEMAITKTRATSNERQDTIVVQGIVDMLIETSDGLILVDFKTDRIGKSQTAERAKLYAGQLKLYSRAAETILKKPVITRWLYFLHPGGAVRV